MSESSPLAEWGILELMGHVRIAGYITEEEHFGAKVGRIDIPGPNGETVTQFFGGSSIYRLTPCSEEIARAVARTGSHAPVSRWELRLPEPKEASHPGVEEAASVYGYGGVYGHREESQIPDDIPFDDEESDSGGFDRP